MRCARVRLWEEVDRLLLRSTYRIGRFIQISPSVSRIRDRGRVSRYVVMCENGSANALTETRKRGQWGNTSREIGRIAGTA